MTGRIETRLQELGIELPEASAPVAAYVPFTSDGSKLYVSGQVTVWNGELRYLGKVGQTLSVAEGKQAARLCGLNLLAQAKAGCDGNLDRIIRVLKLGGFVNCGPDFTEHPAVVNGASELMVDVFGNAGRHARFAVGVASLPMGVSVEVEAVFEIA